MTFLSSLTLLNWLELIAVLTGLLSIWFNSRISILVYPIGMLSVLLYSYIFFENQWYGNMLINIAYFVISGYGWYNWVRKKEDGSKLKVSFLKGKEQALYIIITLAIFVPILLVNPSEIDLSTLDAFTSSLGLVGMILVSQKKVENWIYYLIADVILVPMCLTNGLYLTSVQYIVYCVLAVLGIRNWSKEARK